MRTQNYSRKRQAIYELLLSTDIHPSADWIYNTLKPAYPDLSLGTVYRNLKVLEEKRIVKSVAVVGGSERYDARMSVHSHFVCRCCGRVEDVFHREELSELMGMSDRLIIMKDGAVMKEFSRSRTLSDAEIIQYMI